MVVVGAGLAGLSAARALHQLGYEVVVLEGRDRPGGRCWLAANPPGPRRRTDLDRRYQRFQRFLLSFPESMQVLLDTTVQRLLAREARYAGHPYE